MSVAAIRAALETHLSAMSPSLTTAWENQDFKPPSPKTPFQFVNIMLADPDNPEFGGGYREQGYMQVTLHYPLQEGTAAAMARAALIRATFPKDLSLTKDGVTLTINRTPAIGNGGVDGDHWALPVKIQFHANIF